MTPTTEQKTKTPYVVLQKIAVPQEEGESEIATTAWAEVKKVDADNGEAAIRLAVNGDEGGTFVAVPQRSWNPVNASVETTRRVAFSA